MTVARGGKLILLNGMMLIMAGLLWGLALRDTPYPRLALAAHIEFMVNGILYIVVAMLLLKLPHRVGPNSILVILLSALVTWVLVLSEVANSWWGATQLLSIAAHEAGAPGAAPWQEMIVKMSHIVPALGLVVAWSLLLIGFVRTPTASAE